MHFFQRSLAAIAFSAVLPMASAEGIQLKPAWSGIKIDRPITLLSPADGTGRQFLVEQRGKVRILPSDQAGKETKTFLDLSDRKMEENQLEEGLIGMAFHPKFQENGQFYVCYSQQDPKRSIVSEFKVSASDPDKADPATERILLQVPQPFWNHNSGNMLFAEDGKMFIAFGDGGKRDDPMRFAQNRFSFLGKIIRIDVDTRTGSRQYGIPSDNPFLKQEGVLPELYATGLRNPWGISIDKETGLFWCADVGQDIWEEVNLITKGGNYGWSWREGAQPFVIRQDAAPGDGKFIDPIHQYAHSEGLSITGGFVYRGKSIPALAGQYLYGDFANGRIWALNYDSTAAKVTANTQLFQAPLDAKGQATFKPTAFIEDPTGEPIMLDWNGSVQRILAK